MSELNIESKNKNGIENKKNILRAIPGMDILLAKDWVQHWTAEIGRNTVKDILNHELTGLRRDILKDVNFDDLDNELETRCVNAFKKAAQSNLRHVINATGVVIHTNLGRSLIADEAIHAMKQAAENYSNLEYDIDNGIRGQRNSLIENLLCNITGAEAAIVVNNNAGAVLLCLSALAKNSEVIVSRGELVEIGGSFRIPDIMSLSGAILHEVGTTNRTHLFDYENAINENTSMLLKVHPSNFKIEGFTTAPERSELAKLAHDNKPRGGERDNNTRGGERDSLIFMEDAGSGLLVDGELLNLSGEISIKQSLAQGVDLITFSGDKMLGGPQIGVIAGKKSIINKLRKYPLLRALRVDKATFAAFEATLRLYMREEFDKIPTLEMIRRPEKLLKEQAESLAKDLSDNLDLNHIKIEVVKTDDAVGGGSYPEKPLTGWGVAIYHDELSAGRLQALMRGGEVPVICGARDNALIIHVRTLRNGDKPCGGAHDNTLIVKRFKEII